MAIIDLSIFNPILDIIFDILKLVMVIFYLVLFFVLQYYLIKGYVFLGKLLYNTFPVIKIIIDKITP